MSRIFNFPFTIFLLILGNCFNFILKIFISYGVGNVYPIFNKVSLVSEVCIPVVSFVFAIGYFFCHYQDWQTGFSWKIVSRWFFVFIFILPWLFHFSVNSVSISPNDIFSFHDKPNSYRWFCGVEEIIRDKDKKIIAEITLCEEHIETIIFSYPTLTVLSDRGRVVYKKNFLLRWKY